MLFILPYSSCRLRCIFLFTLVKDYQKILTNICNCGIIRIVFNNVLNINIKQEAFYENIGDITWL